MSFRTKTHPKLRATASALIDARELIVEKLMERKSQKKKHNNCNSEMPINSAQIAQKLGVDRSVLHRQLRGDGDMSVGALAQIFWALGYRLKFSVADLSSFDGFQNHSNVMHSLGSANSAGIIDGVQINYTRPDPVRAGGASSEFKINTTNN